MKDSALEDVDIFISNMSEALRFQNLVIFTSWNDWKMIIPKTFHQTLSEVWQCVFQTALIQFEKEKKIPLILSTGHKVDKH